MSTVTFIMDFKNNFLRQFVLPSLLGMEYIIHIYLSTCKLILNSLQNPDKYIQIQYKIIFKLYLTVY